MYPPYLLLATSAVGLAAVRRLALRGVVAGWASWVVGCLYLGKLAMLVGGRGAWAGVL